MVTVIIKGTQEGELCRKKGICESRRALWWLLITSWQVEGETGETVETVADFTFEAPKSLQLVIAAMKLKDSYSFEGKL